MATRPARQLQTDQVAASVKDGVRPAPSTPHTAAPWRHARPANFKLIRWPPPKGRVEARFINTPYSGPMATRPARQLQTDQVAASLKDGVRPLHQHPIQGPMATRPARQLQTDQVAASRGEARSINTPYSGPMATRPARQLQTDQVAAGLKDGLRPASSTPHTAAPWRHARPANFKLITWPPA